MSYPHQLLTILFANNNINGHRFLNDGFSTIYLNSLLPRATPGSLNPYLSSVDCLSQLVCVLLFQLTQWYNYLMRGQYPT